MKNSGNCQIISVQASAGSGKTYSLAKRYISLLLNSDDDTSLKNIIAVTFANKAAVEMKYRVIEYLKKAALGLDSEGIMDGLGFSRAKTAEKSNKALSDILSGYDSFNIGTIDSFINYILKACAINIDISPNFKIEKDYTKHLTFALDSFLENAAKHPHYRDILLDYISQYLMSEKTGWFPKNDIYNEIDKVFSKAGNTGKDISVIKSDFKNRIFSKSSSIFEKVKFFAQSFPKPGIYANFINAVNKVLEEGTKVFYNPEKIPKAFASKHLKYKKGAEPDPLAQAAWAEIVSDISDLCEFYAANYYGVYSEIYSNITGEFDLQAKKDELVFLNDINRKAMELFEESGAVMPEIYYRLSEKYKHFLVDEFQDTSPVQWAGIKRFLEESLASGGTFFYVGDAKQAIYDFRGGSSEIFYRAANEFPGIYCDITVLKENYRSRKEIVEFNNGIFSAENLAKYLEDVYEDELAGEYKDLLSVYSSSGQNFRTEKEGGYIEIDFIEKDIPDEEEAVKKLFLEKIEDILTRYGQNDITVLCRTNSEAAAASTWLLEKGLNVESTQTLNIRNNSFIKQIMSLIKFIDSPVDTLSFASFILGEIFTEASGIPARETEEFLFRHNTEKNSEVFYKDFRENYEAVWKEFFEEFFTKAGFIPVYELTIALLDKFKVIESFAEEKAFIMRFLELIKEFETEDAGLKNFIAYFEDIDEKDEALYVKSGSGSGIKVMTAHRAKGLQFPVVVLPFLKLSENKTDKPYFDTRAEKINLLFLSKNIAAFSDKLKSIYTAEKAKTLLSEMNILYVSLTRAEHELYAIVPHKAGTSNNTVSKLFGRENIKKGEKGSYQSKSRKTDEITDRIKSGYKDVMKHLESGELPNLDTNKLKKRGTMLHYALSHIISLKNKDISKEILRAENFTKRKFLYEETGWIKEELDALFTSQEIAGFFNYEEAEIFNEKEIVSSLGETLRIDKLIDTGNCIIIIDFKTSNYDAEQNTLQIKNYMNLMHEMYPEKDMKGYIADINNRKAVEV